MRPGPQRTSSSGTAGELGSLVGSRFGTVQLAPRSSTHWYACLRALGIRTRGLYQTTNTFVSLALTAGINVHCRWA